MGSILSRSVIPVGSSMDRRTALNRIVLVLGAAATGPSAAAFLSGCTAPGEGYRPAVFTPEELERLGRLAEIILPRTDTPGALDAGAHRFIDLLLSEYYPADESAALAQGIRQLMEGLPSEARPMEEQLRALDERVFSQPDEARAPGESYSVEQTYRELRQLVIFGYYTSRVSEEQELRPHAMGPWQGDIPLPADGRARI